MKSLRQLLDSIDTVSEQRTALDSDLVKYREGLISLSDLKKSEEFRRMPIEDRWKQGLLSMRDLTPMDKYRLGIINQDQLARSQAIEPVYPELAAAGVGGAIRAGLGLLGRKGAETTARQAASRVEPTLTKPPVSTPAAPTPVAPTPKPKIERRPGESVADAIKRAQREKDGPAVWRNPRTGEVTTSPPSGGAPPVRDPFANPTFKDTTGRERYTGSLEKTIRDREIADADKKRMRRALAISALGHAGLVSIPWLKSPGKEIQEPGPGTTSSPQGRTSPNTSRPISVELIPVPVTPQPNSPVTTSPAATPDIVTAKIPEPTASEPLAVRPTPGPQQQGPRPTQPAPTTKITTDQPALAPSSQAQGGPTTVQGTPPRKTGTGYDIEKEFSKGGFKESLIKEFQTYVDLKSKVRFSRK